jgi:hypothetical protein
VFYVSRGEQALGLGLQRLTAIGIGLKPSCSKPRLPFSLSSPHRRMESQMKSFASYAKSSQLYAASCTSGFTTLHPPVRPWQNFHPHRCGKAA